MNTSSLEHSLPTKVTTPSYKWFRTISTLPLNKFIEVAVDGNFSALVIEGFPPEIDLLIAWDNIQQEYADAMGDGDYRMYLELFREVKRLEVTLFQINALVEILRQAYYKPLADKLNKLLMTSFKFDPIDEEAYQKELSRCLNRSKGIKIDYDLKKMQLDAIQLKNKTGDHKYSREYFQSILITLSDHAKFPVSESITVFEFCTRITRYHKYCESFNKK